MSWKGDCHEGVRDFMLRWLKSQLEKMMAEHMDLQDVYFDCVSFGCYSSVQTFALCTSVLDILPTHSHHLPNSTTTDENTILKCRPSTHQHHTSLSPHPPSPQHTSPHHAETPNPPSETV